MIPIREQAKNWLPVFVVDDDVTKLLLDESFAAWKSNETARFGFKRAGRYQFPIGAPDQMHRFARNLRRQSEKKHKKNDDRR